MDRIATIDSSTTAGLVDDAVDRDARVRHAQRTAGR